MRRGKKHDCWQNVTVTNPFKNLHACSATFIFGVLGPLERILGYAIGEVTVRSPSERSPAKDQLVRADAE